MKHISNIHLAPLDGITDVSFRSLMFSTARIVTYSEMLPSQGILRKKLPSYLYIRGKEKDYGVQIFGTNINEILAASKVVEKWDVDFINFNFGCPSKSIIKSGAGGYWLKSIDRMIELSHKLRNNLTIPYSFKIRLGYNEYAIEHFSDLDVDELILHGRTVKQNYSGTANWEPIFNLKDKIQINYSIVGNGDIFTLPDFIKRSNQKSNTGKVLDGFMIARGVILNPLFLSEVNNYQLNLNLKSEQFNLNNSFYDAKSRVKLWFRYYDLWKEYCVDFSRLKHNSMFFIRNFENAKSFKVKLSQAKTEEDILLIFNQIDSIN